MEDKEKELERIRKEQKDIGVATESMNRLPMFQPTLRAKFEARSFESKYGKITIEGRLGQAHKNVLETILFKRKAFALKGASLKILYNEYEVRKYLSQTSEYDYRTYQRLIKDMITAYVKLEKEDETIEGTLIREKLTAKNYSYKTRSNLPAIAGKEIEYAVVEFGYVATKLIKEELRFTYDPKPIMNLDSGISQAIVRFLKTHKHHPETGYHLKALIENLVENVEGQNWRNIKRFLKKDAEKLEAIGIVIDFKKDRLYVVKKHYV